MIKYSIKNILIFFLLLAVVVPVWVGAQTPPANEPPIIPNCGDTARKYPECGYNDLLQLVKNIINWIIWISVPVAAGVFAWAGFKYMTSAVVDQKSAAKEMMLKVFIGFVVILSAWLIINTILEALLNPNFPKNAIPVGS